MLGKATEQLRQTEQVLSLRGLVQFTPAGRQITPAGLRRLKS
jgi:ribosomal protein S19E (S16A)